MGKKGNSLKGNSAPSSSSARHNKDQTNTGIKETCNTVRTKPKKIDVINGVEYLEKFEICFSDSNFQNDSDSFSAAKKIHAELLERESRLLLRSQVLVEREEKLLLDLDSAGKEMSLAELELSRLISKRDKLLKLKEKLNERNEDLMRQSDERSRVQKSTHESVSGELMEELKTLSKKLEISTEESIKRATTRGK